MFQFDCGNIKLSTKDQLWLADHFFCFYLNKTDNIAKLGKHNYCLLCYRPEPEWDASCICGRPKVLHSFKQQQQLADRLNRSKNKPTQLTEMKSETNVDKRQKNQSSNEYEPAGSD